MELYVIFSSNFAAGAQKFQTIATHVLGAGEKSYRVNINIHGLFRAWVKKHRRLVLVAASLAGGGAIVYYGTEALGLVSQVKTKKEKDPARSTILQKEAEDQADTQYICCLPVLDRFIVYI